MHMSVYDCSYCLRDLRALANALLHNLGIQMLDIFPLLPFKQHMSRRIVECLNQTVSLCLEFMSMSGDM